MKRLRMSRRLRPAAIASIAGACLVLLAMLTAWLQGSIGSGAGSLVYLLLALAMVCLIASAYLDFAVSPIAPKQQDDNRLAEESERLGQRFA